jgi:hypothetical protein
MAIRRPNKPPTTGTQVYNAIARTGTGAAATVTGVGFAPDVIHSFRRGGTYDQVWFDRLRGATQQLRSNATAAEATDTTSVTGFDSMDGVGLGSDTNGNQNASGVSYINHFFKRSPGFFDEVCWTGDSATNLQPHNLGVKPELLIMKSRTSTSDWETAILTNTTEYALKLNSTAVASTGGVNSISVGTSSTQFSKTIFTPLYISGNTYVAYLFASLPGISKVGSYIGNGTTQTINCGFAAGARFVLIKRTDAAGDWYVYDTARGMTTVTDPYLLLNSTAAETATLGSVTTATTGFALNSAILAAVNVSAAIISS